LVADVQNDWDEELYWQVSQAWRLGGVPYADMFDHKAPLVYALQLLYSGFTENFWLVRVNATLALIVSAAALAFAMWPGRRDLAAAFTFLILLTLSCFGCLGANTETLYATYILFTGAALLRGVLIPAALAAALAVNIKYTVGLDIAGVTAFVVIAQRLSLHRAIRFFVMFGLIALGIWLGFYAYFAASGVDLFHATVVVNLMHAGSDRRALLPALGSFAVTRFIIVSVGLTLWAALSGSKVDPPLRWGLAAWAFASLLQATITGKTFFHYFIPIFIPFCVFLVAHWEREPPRRYRVASVALGATLALVLLVQGAVLNRAFAETEAWLHSEVCDSLRGHSVYIADDLLSAYRVCDIPANKWMYPEFVFGAHFIPMAQSRGLRELESFDLVVITPGSRFAETVYELRGDEGILVLSPPRR
jgi:hypothetical protein